MTTTNQSGSDPSTQGTESRIIPVLVYEDIEGAHDFLVSAFGFTSGGLHRANDGSVVHGEVRLGEAAIWLHRVTAEHQMVSPRDAAQSYGGLVIMVPDVDAHYRRSVSSGASIDREPTDMEYGLREYGARDPENHRWWFSSPLAG